MSVRVCEEGPAAWPVNPRDPTVSTSVLGLHVGTTSLLYLASGIGLMQHLTEPALQLMGSLSHFALLSHDNPQNDPWKCY